MAAAHDPIILVKPAKLTVASKGAVPGRFTLHRSCVKWDATDGSSSTTLPVAGIGSEWEGGWGRGAGGWGPWDRD